MRTSLKVSPNPPFSTYYPVLWKTACMIFGPLGAFFVTRYIMTSMVYVGSPSKEITSAIVCVISLHIFLAYFLAGAFKDDDGETHRKDD